MFHNLPSARNLLYNSNPCKPWSHEGGGLSFEKHGVTRWAFTVVSSSSSSSNTAPTPRSSIFIIMVIQVRRIWEQQMKVWSFWSSRWCTVGDGAQVPYWESVEKERKPKPTIIEFYVTLITISPQQRRHLLTLRNSKYLCYAYYSTKAPRRNICLEKCPRKVLQESTMSYQILRNMFLLPAEPVI